MFNIKDNAEILKDVDLHTSFPNITTLNLKMRIRMASKYLIPGLLPDLSGCKRLESLTLESYSRTHLCFHPNLKEKVRK